MQFSTVAAVLALALAPDRAKPPELACDHARTLRVLFIGNSFTYVQNVPKQVEEIAKALSGPCIETTMLTVGGASLEDHWRADSAVARVRAGNWTHVVLNDQSTFSETWFVEGKPRVGTSGEELLDYGRRFSTLIREKGAQPVIIAHWADAKSPPRDQQWLSYLFAKLAKETGSAVADAGYAIKRMQAELPALNPYFTDNHHLSAPGAYLEALVVYSALTGTSPLGAPRTIRGRAVELVQGTVLDSIVALIDLDERTAAAVQGIAAETFRNTPDRLGALAAPAPLSAEFPTLPTVGDPVSAKDLSGNWSGKTNALGSPTGEPMPIEVRADSIFVGEGRLRFSGPVTIAVEGNHVVIRAPLMPPPGTTRSRPTPLELELRGVRRGAEIVGVATIRQRFAGTAASFTSVARANLQRPSGS